MFVNGFRCLFSIMIVMLVFAASQVVMAETAKPDETGVADSQPKPRIVLLIGEEQDFTGCKKLGSISGQSEESDNEKPYPQRLIIARTNLQKAAADLGGNTIHVLKSNTTRFDLPGMTKQVMFSGEAYDCE